MNKNEDSILINLIPILWKNRKLIIISTVLAGLITAGIVSLQPNYYQSSTTFYPVNSKLLEPSLQINERSIEYYGDDRDIDRILTIAHSNSILEQLIVKEGLAEHYNMKFRSSKDKVRLYKKLNKLYRVIKTEYDAIELSVEDKDPEKAKSITKAARNIIDERSKNIVASSQQKILENLQNTQAANQLHLTQVSDSLYSLRDLYDIYDITTQGEALAAMEMKSPGNQRVQKKIDNYKKGITEVTNLLAIQKELNEAMAQDAIQIQEIQAALSGKISSIHVIEDAFVPLEKSRPRRSIIVLGMMLLTGFFASALVLIRNNLMNFEFT